MIERTPAREAELEAWLDGIKADQAAPNLYAELWLANVEARAIKDKNSPAAADVHSRINAIIGRIEAL